MKRKIIFYISVQLELSMTKDKVISKDISSEEIKDRSTKLPNETPLEVSKYD